ncbi:MAG: polysaccharide pyruvyl transferase family protein [Pleurocapsa sp. MO_192.B19]|nr:polysaccharide pyruvyl transferase family protein [Pleurocapsa sp. MO_192.B19]
MTRKKGVLINGFYGNYNLGDEAMLAGMINLLKKQQEDLSFTVFSNDPQNTQTQYSVESIRRPTRKRLKIQHLLKILQNRYFVLGGGDLLRDSAKSSIAETWLHPLQYAIKLRRRTLVLGISVGEIWKQESKILIPKVLNQVDFLAVRDVKSKLKLEELGVNNTIHVMSDLALHFLPETFSQSKLPTNRPFQVGISVRHLSGRGPSVDASVYTTLLKEIAAVADFLVEKYGATVHFLPFRTYQHSYHPIDDDYESALEVLRYSRYSEKFVVHRYFGTLKDLSSLISGLDLMIGMRLHSLILSAGLGIPAIAAEYAPKVRGFMEEIDQSNLSIPLNSFDRTRLIPEIKNILDNSLAARRNIESGVKNYRERTIQVETALSQTFSII